MVYFVEHHGFEWYLYGCRIKLNNGELGYRYFFSTKKTPKIHWDQIIDIPMGYEVSLRGWMPMLAKKKRDSKEGEVKI